MHEESQGALLSQSLPLEKAEGPPPQVLEKEAGTQGCQCSTVLDIHVSKPPGLKVKGTFHLTPQPSNLCKDVWICPGLGLRVWACRWG